MPIGGTKYFNKIVREAIVAAHKGIYTDFLASKGAKGRDKSLLLFRRKYFRRRGLMRFRSSRVALFKPVLLRFHFRFLGSGERGHFIGHQHIFSQSVDMRDNLGRANGKKTDNSNPEPKVRPKSNTIGRVPSGPPSHGLSSNSVQHMAAHFPNVGVKNFPGLGGEKCCGPP